MLSTRGALLPGVATRQAPRSLYAERLARLRGEILLDEPLSRHTTIGVGGEAACLFYPEDPYDLASAIYLCRRFQRPYVVLGGGSNLLFPDDGFHGIVISTEHLRGACFRGGGVQTLAGEPVSALLSMVRQEGIPSLDFLAGIPGTVGGAVTMNAGIPDKAIGVAVDEVGVFDPESGRSFSLPGRSCGFTYRSSRMAEEGLVVLWARLRLDGESFDRERLLARRRETQPAERSAGCVFRNPSGASAGRLIDAAGLKGTRIGGAVVSELHANFIVNRGAATSAEIRSLIDTVRQKVYKSFRVWLELEIRVVQG